MFIKYNPKDKHVKCIPLITTDAASLVGESLMLRPGTNEITEAEWAAIQPHIKAEIANKVIVAFTVPVTQNGTERKAGTLKAVPASVARKIIEGCENPAVLKKWFNESLPDEILLMVTKRLRHLKIDPDEISNDANTNDELLDDNITPEDGKPEDENELEEELVNANVGEEPKNERMPKKRGRKSKGEETKSKIGDTDAESAEDDTPNFDLNGDGDDEK